MPMRAFPVSATSCPTVLVVAFDPFADRTGVARKKAAILAQLSEERSKSRPNKLLIRAYEIWLRVYDRNVMPHGA